MRLDENFAKEIEFAGKILRDYVRIKIGELNKTFNGGTEQKLVLKKEFFDKGLEEISRLLTEMRKIQKIKSDVRTLEKVSVNFAEESVFFVFLSNGRSEWWSFTNMVDDMDDIEFEEVAAMLESIKECIDKIFDVLAEGIQKIVAMKEGVMKQIKDTGVYEKVASEKIKSRFEGGEQG